MHPIELFIKNFLGSAYHPLPSKYDISKAPSIPSNPLAIKLNSVIRTVRSPTQEECITIPPHFYP